MSIQSFCLKFIVATAICFSSFHMYGNESLSDHECVIAKYNRIHRLDEGSVTLNYRVSLAEIPTAETNGCVLNFTPFATGPDGKVHVGETTSLVFPLQNFNGLDLQPLMLSNPYKGNYTVGYFVSLEPSANPLSIAGFAFAGTVKGTNGSQNQMAPISYSLVTSADLNLFYIATLSGNYEMKVPLLSSPCPAPALEASE
ncbi:MAG: hypothetical protein ACXWM7_05985 [Parachlamydiaceae bacterium]